MPQFASSASGTRFFGNVTVLPWFTPRQIALAGGPGILFFASGILWAVLCGAGVLPLLIGIAATAACGVFSVLCFLLGMQSTLAKAGDTLALRTARFAAGSFLPVVGGSVGETLRTVAGSVQYLRAVTGMGAVTVLFFCFLPTFLSVLLFRVCFMLSGAVAGMLACRAEEKVLSELSSVYGYFLATVSTLFITVVFSLTLFAQCAAAG